MQQFEEIFKERKVDECTRLCLDHDATLQSIYMDPFHRLKILRIREFTQPRRRRQPERHKFAYLTTKDNSFARFARAFPIFVHFAEVLVLSTT